MTHSVGNFEEKNWSYSGSNADVPAIRIYRPTWDEFKDFNSYMQFIETDGAHHAGIAKIIPPKEWIPRKNGYDVKAMSNIKIPDPICQVVEGNRGVYQSINVRKKAMNVTEFHSVATSDRYRTPVFSDYEDLERKYWKNVTFVSPIYGADVAGSMTDNECQNWNIQRLGSILDMVNEDYNIRIDGVNTAYLYFGMWKTTFAWHTEDMDLHSINYLHHGDSKFWYSIPPAFARRFERMAAGLFPSLAKDCPAYLRHKMCLISPMILRQNSIPYNKIVHNEGEIIITFPMGYHAGFNTGFNIAESTNFATLRWLEYGKRCNRCFCRADMVHISMDCFVQRLQPDRYDAWLAGNDMGRHPLEPETAKMSAAPPPSIEEFLLNTSNRDRDIPLCMLEGIENGKRRHPIHKKKTTVPSNNEENDETTEYVDDESTDDTEGLNDTWQKTDEFESSHDGLPVYSKRRRRRSSLNDDPHLQRPNSSSHVTKAGIKTLGGDFSFLYNNKIEPPYKEEDANVFSKCHPPILDKSPLADYTLKSMKSSDQANVQVQASTNCSFMDNKNRFLPASPQNSSSAVIHSFEGAFLKFVREREKIFQSHIDTSRYALHEKKSRIRKERQIPHKPDKLFDILINKQQTLKTNEESTPMISKLAEPPSSNINPLIPKPLPLWNRSLGSPSFQMSNTKTDLNEPHMSEPKTDILPPRYAANASEGTNSELASSNHVKTVVPSIDGQRRPSKTLNVLSISQPCHRVMVNRKLLTTDVWHTIDSIVSHETSYRCTLSNVSINLKRAEILIQLDFDTPPPTGTLTIPVGELLHNKKLLSDDSLHKHIDLLDWKVSLTMEHILTIKNPWEEKRSFALTFT